MTQILFDPVDANVIWASVEIDGVHRSDDRGRTWKKVGDGLLSEDIHGVAVVRNGSKLIYATTNKGLHVSRDEGGIWQFQALPSTWQYTRTSCCARRRRCHGVPHQRQRPAGLDRPPAAQPRPRPALEDAGLPGDLNSGLGRWRPQVGSQADLRLQQSRQIFRSTDGGSWTRLKREFAGALDVWQTLN